MASTCCSCRTSALRTFARTVAQVHLPNDNLARAAPWHETRRQLHQRGTAEWSAAITKLPYRPKRAVATYSRSTAAETEESQHSLKGGEQDLAHEGETPIAAAESQSDATHGDPAALDDLLAEEEKMFAFTRPSKLAKEKRTREAVATQAEAAPAPLTDAETQEYPPIYEEAMAYLEAEVFSVEQSEAEQREREVNRLRIRAERAKAKEQAKKEQQRQKEEEKERRLKERLKARPDWAAQKAALKEKFPEGWKPRKKLSPDALNGIRALNKQFPETYTTGVLADKFEVSPEAIRRILRSKWEPTVEEEEDRERRWQNRGVNIWQHYAAIGKKPPAKWREAGVAVRPRGGRPRSEPEHDWSDGYDEPEKKDDSGNLEQMKRFRRQQKLARQLL